jgi:demethylmenaquinone methyltransferase/2-methoxy-6-polyprenyl-1,4-benzoquinol methylase
MSDQAAPLPFEDGDPLAGQFGARVVAADERRALIRRVFRSVAPRYDVMNDLMSMGIHRLWKDRFVERLPIEPDMVGLDLAGGTGDVAIRLAGRGVGVICVDPSAEMLAVARRRSPLLQVAEAEAEHLPYPDRSQDVVTIAFGIRNVTRMNDALGEIHRVLKPGGVFACLEFSTPRPWLAPAYRLWSATVIPALGAVIAGDPAAYRYLVQSIARFPKQSEFAAMMQSAGFERVTWHDFSFGIASMHVGWRM